MKFIYLDIDGVMNSNMSAIKNVPFESDMDPNKLMLLKDLITKSGAEGIILTSDRRYSKFDLEDKKKVFNKYGIDVLGITRVADPDDIFDCRGDEIKDHIKENQEFIDGFVILDDHDDGIKKLFPNNFIFVSGRFGLTEKICERALMILINNKPWK